MDQYIGRLLDNRYEILEIIGTGGMAVVYKARCHRLNRLVAIKILKDEFARDEEFRRRFHAEGEAVAMLSHPNIVQVYDVSSSDNANFIVMELIDGISLKQYMEAKGVLNWKETLHFAMQIASGLEHAHSRGIVHRDIKPHNVMVLKDGSVKVMDFGIARVMSKSNTLTKEALGSVHYISPEQAKGSHTDNRSDIYSLGVVMYEMMAGRPPYDGESPVAVAIQHINGGAALPSTFNPNIPRGLEQIIMKAMAVELPDRFSSAGEMLKDMEEFRKNPSIEFHYKSIIDDATRKVPVILTTTQPRTTAEKVEKSKTGVVRQYPVEPPKPQTQKKQTTSGTGKKKTKTSSAPSKKASAPSHRQKTDPKPSRVGTVAIVVCSLVAALAIILFLVALFNGMLLNRDRDLIEVPNLVGEFYTEDLEAIYSDFEIRFNDQEYDSTFAKGQIMDQEPAAGSGVKVQKGSEIWITISMGEEPEVKVMESLLGLSQGEAESYLKGQGFTPLVWTEHSEFYEAGQVIRTDPVAGTELVEGQTIKLYISRGPEVELEEMPDVTGMDESTARKVLSQLGFDNVEVRTVESDRPKGIVVKQSEQDGVAIDINTQIILTLSEGPAETTAPQETETEPEETEPKEVIRDVTFELPHREAPYTLTIFCNGWQVTAARQIESGTTEITMEMSGSGTKRYDLYIDDVYYGSQDVTFGQYG